MATLSDKVCVVTGAASGMGRAYALHLAKLGARLAICDVDEKGLAETHALVPDAMITLVDVGDPGAMYQFADDVEQKLGCATLVINNAGIEGSNRPFWLTSDREFDQIMKVNFWGVVYGSRAFLPQLAKHPWSALVNVSSIFGLVGVPGNSDYCASKFAVRGFTESLMVEVAESGSNIQVHLVHPGGIDTQIARKPTSQAFKQYFLTTPPEAFVDEVLRQVMRNQKRIVAGNQGRRTLIASKFLPLSWLTRMIGNQMRRFAQPEDFQQSQHGFKNVDR